MPAAAPPRTGQCDTAMNDQLPDYYGVLNVARTATRQEIARAYRALMRQHHPDLEGGTAGSNKTAGSNEGAGGVGSMAGVGTDSGGNSGLLRIMEAFAVLRDAKSRAAYDRALSVPHISSGGPREVPVRRVKTPQPPLLRVSPVLWERGPWPGAGTGTG